MDLPTELKMKFLLETKTANDLINVCKTNKTMMELCKTELVAKHIMINFIKIKKPKTFRFYKDFLKHYSQVAKNVHKDSLKDSVVSFYNGLDDIIKQRIKRNPSFKETWERKHGELGPI
jgi:hypothetical protein